MIFRRKIVGLESWGDLTLYPMSLETWEWYRQQTGWLSFEGLVRNQRNSWWYYRLEFSRMKQVQSSRMALEMKRWRHQTRLKMPFSFLCVSLATLFVSSYVTAEAVITMTTTTNNHKFQTRFPFTLNSQRPVRQSERVEETKVEYMTLSFFLSNTHTCVSSPVKGMDSEKTEKFFKFYSWKVDNPCDFSTKLLYYNKNSVKIQRILCWSIFRFESFLMVFSRSNNKWRSHRTNSNQKEMCLTCRTIVDESTFFSSAIFLWIEFNQPWLTIIITRSKQEVIFEKKLWSVTRGHSF